MKEWDKDVKRRVCFGVPAGSTQRGCKTLTCETCSSRFKRACSKNRAGAQTCLEHEPAFCPFASLCSHARLVGGVGGWAPQSTLHAAVRDLPNPVPQNPRPRLLQRPRGPPVQSSEPRRSMPAGKAARDQRGGLLLVRPIHVYDGMAMRGALAELYAVAPSRSPGRLSTGVRVNDPPQPLRILFSFVGPELVSLV